MGWHRLGGLGAPEALARPLRDPPNVDIVLLLFRPGDTLSETERARGGEGGRGGGEREGTLRDPPDIGIVRLLFCDVGGSFR